MAFRSSVDTWRITVSPGGTRPSVGVQAITPTSAVLERPLPSVSVAHAVGADNENTESRTINSASILFRETRGAFAITSMIIDLSDSYHQVRRLTQYDVHSCELTLLFAGVGTPFAV